MTRTLFALDPAIDREAVAADLRCDGRAQVRDFLRSDAAEAIHAVVARGTEWGLSWSGGSQRSKNIRAKALRRMTPGQQGAAARQAAESEHAGLFASLSAQYPMVEAYVKGWSPGHPLNLLLNHPNTAETVEFVRQVSGLSGQIKADALATLHAPGHFLPPHHDCNDDDGRKLASVLRLARNWRPEGVNYQQFHNTEGDTTTADRPRFNPLNLFPMSRPHRVSLVSGFAPTGRLAITGWFRSR